MLISAWEIGLVFLGLFKRAFTPSEKEGLEILGIAVAFVGSSGLSLLNCATDRVIKVAITDAMDDTARAGD